MIYGDTVQETRQMFFTSWDKYLQRKPLSPLENQIAQVILTHPEYHQVFENKEKFQNQAYTPELADPNPFLHMGLHLAVQDQVTTDRPVGIHAIYKKLIDKYKDPLKVEHLIMEQLAECLWLAQKNNLAPDETNYLQLLVNL